MPQETKGGESRIVYLTARVKEMLATLPPRDLRTSTSF